MTPTLLLILDGWGIAPPGPGNAPFLAKTPCLDALFARYPHTELAASGRDVGLPSGYIGNSEVGHLNIGAGRVVYQDMTRIDVAIEEGEFVQNHVILECIEAARKNGTVLHLAGLLSDGGVHSHIGHLEALARMADAADVPVRIHCFMDGRDTPPQSGMGYIGQLEAILAPLKNASIASVTGRYYAMDRDTRWERVQEAWETLAHGAGAVFASAEECVQAAYAAGITDEFIKPACIGTHPSPVQDGDALFFFNFRADRMRELARVLTESDFTGFERGKVPVLAALASMTSYDATFSFPVAFPKEPVKMTLGETLSRLGCSQLRLAETEKFAHVTYFFNGGEEKPFAGEKRIIIESPRDVDTYDKKPAMSAIPVTDAFLEAWESGQYDFVVCNLANGDMVGHTGILEAAIAACETVDTCVERMVKAVLARQGRMLLIADHGNCEMMLDAQGNPHTAHTTNPVPCLLVEEGTEHRLRPGRLADVAPTLLSLWHLEIPSVMTGQVLVERS